MATEDYVWPCDLRRAHGPHPTWLTDPGTFKWCPGVLAHPDTQIGRGTLPERPEDDRPWLRKFVDRGPSPQLQVRSPVIHAFYVTKKQQKRAREKGFPVTPEPGSIVCNPDGPHERHTASMDTDEITCPDCLRITKERGVLR